MDSKCYKRRNEDEGKQENDGNYEIDTNVFKSAKEQLLLDGAKQNQLNQQQNNNYSTAKRPMNNPPANNPAKLVS